MQTNRGVARRDCRCAQARTRFTPLQRFAKEKLCLSIKAFCAVANLCAAARRRPDCTAARRFPLVPANAETQSGFPRARDMSERSPDCAARNPGMTARLAPDFVSLNPGYACCLARGSIPPRFIKCIYGKNAQQNLQILAMCRPIATECRPRPALRGHCRLLSSNHVA
jgi:hypothetical protein